MTEAFDGVEEESVEYNPAVFSVAADDEGEDLA